MSVLRVVSDGAGYPHGFESMNPDFYHLFKCDGEEWYFVGLIDLDNEIVTLWLDAASVSEYIETDHVKWGGKDGLKYTHDEFMDILAETDVKISDLIIRASNCVELLIVCAAEDDSMANERYREFCERHADETIQYRSFDHMLVSRGSQYKFKCFFVVGETKGEPKCSIYMNTETFSCDECGK